MTARRRFLRGLAIAGITVLSGCGKWSWNYRYRLTLFIETPEGEKSGTGVVEILVTKAAISLNQMPMNWELRGEAVAVDLGKRGTLFALIGGGRPAQSFLALPQVVFERTEALDRRYTAEERESKLEGLKASAQLTRDEIPFLARFRDINDPKTVEIVDPDDLAKSFGEGVRLLHAIIEMTKEPATPGIDKKLGWLSQYYDRQLGGARFPAIRGSVANQLSSGYFKAP
ncbi:hypothetical+protein [Methylocapsa aurea]|uniref:hypothetical protein n=1 Tax=Methylocapsa aurea TaxID=663610 RepID=UPI003D18911B